MKKTLNKAVAMAYNKQNPKPKIIASGKEKMALLLVQKAKEFNIPIFQNKELVESLIKLDIDEEINKDSYIGVAKILIWLNENEKNTQFSK